ncbi:hypothetical protein [Devosia marina]|jgi:hypothetical protein|uniref:Uncharacterized protein n=1 Tax=Devosia marina TaxID=2683198 RepID=A0A7X3FRQ9_9HYPH|nr:hypothetical protein [Devosia marina]MVS99403.1 hypothetical protein [Devosia marina]
MAGNETEIVGLPVLIEPQRLRPSLLRSESSAAFVSQLIAARAHMATQRARRRTTPEGAVGAYGQTARLTQRRMPQGYRKTVVA